MSLKVETLLELLRSLEVYVQKLEQIRPASARVWETNIENYWAVLHGLQIAVQHALDIELDPERVFHLVHADREDFRRFTTHSYTYLQEKGLVS